MGLILKFETVITKDEILGADRVDPKINSTKEYSIGDYAEDFSYVLLHTSEENGPAFRKYVGYIEDVE